MQSVADHLAAQLGFDVQACQSAVEALSSLTRRPANLALVDDVNSLELLVQIQSLAPGCDVVLIDSGSDGPSAIEAIQAGACDYIEKPFDPERLRGVLNCFCEEAGRRAHIFALDTLVAEQSEFRGLFGRSRVMQELFNLIQRLAPHARHVLISGETGTGKELVARAFHQAGPRRDRPFMAVNCSAISDVTLDPFARADEGTLFLDEIGELPRVLQTRLLHLLDDGGHVIPGGLVAVTSRDLGADVASGRFSRRLYERLSGVAITIPALRERREDIPYLTAAFVRECGHRFLKSFDGLTPVAERMLLNARWDGNVRELRNVVERACMLAEGRLISERELTGTGSVTSEDDQGGMLGAMGSLLRNAPSTVQLGYLEREHIVDALRLVSGNRMAAAKVLGISRRALYRRLARHHILHPAPKARRSGTATCARA